jgi:hypothetical protein
MNLTSFALGFCAGLGAAVLAVWRLGGLRALYVNAVASDAVVARVRQSLRESFESTLARHMKGEPEKFHQLYGPRD